MYHVPSMITYIVMLCTGLVVSVYLGFVSSVKEKKSHAGRQNIAFVTMLSTS